MADDSDPKEQFVYHTAGTDGRGGSSYINSVVLRDKDDNAGWASAADGTLEERYYYYQNWRGDVVAIIDDSDNLIEHIRHSSSGVPIGIVGGDAEE